mmetsp:Transcript_16210/g.50269  ORF Transcript_16210/g.50269 Transcript_16210/m.50269 type:complete len:209 (+) Transcript_16210:615-1241(+)
MRPHLRRRRRRVPRSSRRNRVLGPRRLRDRRGQDEAARDVFQSGPHRRRHRAYADAPAHHRGRGGARARRRDGRVLAPLRKPHRGGHPLPRAARGRDAGGRRRPVLHARQAAGRVAALHGLHRRGDAREDDAGAGPRHVHLLLRPAADDQVGYRETRGARPRARPHLLLLIFFGVKLALCIIPPAIPPPIYAAPPYTFSPLSANHMDL